MKMILLSQIALTEWIFGIIGVVLGGIILAAVIATATHISNSDKHPKKADVVYKGVCEAEMKGQRDCVEVEIKNMKEALGKLEGTMASNFAALFTKIEKALNNKMG